MALPIWMRLVCGCGASSTGTTPNTEHRHSRIRFVTPAQRHQGQDITLLAKRHAVYQQARERHPERWAGDTRNWTPIGDVTLNPERLEMQQTGAA